MSQTAANLYDEAHRTKRGLKVIECEGRPAFVHETGCLRGLIDAYYRQRLDMPPRNFNEEIASAKLAEPDIHFVLEGFMRFNAELAEELVDVSSRREFEYQQRREIRERASAGRRVGQHLNTALPSQKQEFYRDLLYSGVLDRIGDLVSSYGLDFDLNRLV